MSAARHTLTAVGAAGAVWSCSPEVWVSYLFTRFTEVNPKRGHLKGVTKAEGVTGFFESLVGRGKKLICFDPEHPLGLVVVGLQKCLPVGDVFPAAGCKKLLRWAIQSVRIDQ